MISGYIPPCNVGLDYSQPRYFSTERNVRESASEAQVVPGRRGGERAFCAGVQSSRRSLSAFNDRSNK